MSHELEPHRPQADAFVDNVFNFPRLAEAYRVAALDVVGRRARLQAAG